MRTSRRSAYSRCLLGTANVRQIKLQLSLSRNQIVNAIKHTKTYKCFFHASTVVARFTEARIGKPGSETIFLHHGESPSVQERTKHINICYDIDWRNNRLTRRRSIQRERRITTSIATVTVVDLDNAPLPGELKRNFSTMYRIIIAGVANSTMLVGNHC